MNNTEKKYNCEVIQDLLPLYQDNICSDASKAAVEEHLNECSSCKTILEKLKNTYLDDRLTQEKNSILEAHYKQEKRRTFAIGVCVAGILMIPVIVCLICNLAIGHALDWFFIVLASLLLVASLSVVPLIAPAKQAGLWTIGSFVGSLLLLLGVICIYAHGHWFFLAAVPTLFGLSVLLMPYVIYHIPLPEPLSHQKGLLVMLWDTIWLYAIIFICGIYSAAADYWRIALQITSFCVLLPWALFAVIRYIKVHPLSIAGICTIITGIFCAVINDVIYLIIGEDAYTWHLSDVNFSDWRYPSGQANTFVIIFVTLIIIGFILIGCGIRLQKNKTTQSR